MPALGPLQTSRSSRLCGAGRACPRSPVRPREQPVRTPRHRSGQSTGSGDDRQPRSPVLTPDPGMARRPEHRLLVPIADATARVNGIVARRLGVTLAPAWMSHDCQEQSNGRRGRIQGVRSCLMSDRNRLPPPGSSSQIPQGGLKNRHEQRRPFRRDSEFERGMRWVTHLLAVGSRRLYLLM